MELGPIDRHNAELNRLLDKMNLIHGTRIGWEDKQKYRELLIEMASQGVITSDEYDARMEWVDVAKTAAELKVSVLDLPKASLTPRPEPKWQRPHGAMYFLSRNPWYAGIIAACEWIIFLIGCVLGAPITMILGGIFAVMWTALTIKRVRDENNLKGKS